MFCLGLQLRSFYHFCGLYPSTDYELHLLVTSTSFLLWLVFSAIDLMLLWWEMTNFRPSKFTDSECQCSTWTFHSWYFRYLVFSIKLSFFLYFNSWTLSFLLAISQGSVPFIFAFHSFPVAHSMHPIHFIRGFIFHCHVAIF